jgi:hypothetical protein
MSGPDFKWWQPSCFYHLKSGQIGLDRFIKKRVINNILFMPKRPRLAKKMVAAILFLPFEIRTNRSGPDHLKTGPFEIRTQKSVRKAIHSNIGLFGIR